MTLVESGAATAVPLDTVVATESGAVIDEATVRGFGWSLADEDYDPRPVYPTGCSFCGGAHTRDRCWRAVRRA